MATLEKTRNIVGEAQDIILQEMVSRTGLGVSDQGIKDYISKMIQLNTSSNYLTTKKNQFQDIVGKNRYKRDIIILLVILIIVLLLLVIFIVFRN